jgi:hypothetical protein
MFNAYFLGADVARKQQLTIWSEAELLAAVSDYPTQPVNPSVIR